MNLPPRYRATLRLALPVMLSRLGILTIVAADTAMTGWAGARELAAYAISAAPHTPLLLIGVGLMTGTVVLVSQAEGAGRRGETGFLLRAAWRQAWILGVILLGLFHTGEWILLALGQRPSLALEGAEVLAMFGWGMPAVMVFAATTMFLEAIGRPLAGMIFMLTANLLNVAFNWVFIHGHLGAPEMGAEGAALATSLARWNRRGSGSSPGLTPLSGRPASRHASDACGSTRAGAGAPIGRGGGCSRPASRSPPPTGSKLAPSPP